MSQQSSFVVDAMQHATYRLLIDGEWVEGAGPRVSVRDKYRLQPLATITVADAAQVKRAVDYIMHTRHSAAVYPLRSSAVPCWNVPPH